MKMKKILLKNIKHLLNLGEICNPLLIRFFGIFLEPLPCSLPLTIPTPLLLGTNEYKGLGLSKFLSIFKDKFEYHGAG